MVKAPFAECDKCSLINNIFVPTEVNSAKVLALAEAPGYNESVEGRPLVGVAGKDLDSIIEGLGHTRKDATYINSVNCRPTKIVDSKTYNRTPSNEEITCCNKRLIAEIDLLSPIIIVCMGKTPYIALGGNINVVMNQVVGTKFVWQDKYDVIVTYHPAAISYAGGANTERGRLIKKTIEDAFKIAFEAKPRDRQLRLL